MTTDVNSFFADPATFEAQCPGCKEWTPRKDWLDTYGECEMCGDHSAIECPKCGEFLDLVLGKEPARRPITPESQAQGSSGS